jgi:Mg-chelatase subunit ChlD
MVQTQFNPARLYPPFTDPRMQVRLPILSAKNAGEESQLKRTDSSTTDSTWATSFTATSSWGRTSPPVDDAIVTLHPTAAQDGLLVKIETPKEPKISRLAHVPCDIVLVIDVSGSMGCNAPVPGDTAENYGLSVLDLVKHAARTILETMDHGDRLGIVTFASKAKVVQKLLPMTKRNKALTENNIESMQPIDATNLWHGILEGLRLFSGEVNTGRVPAVFVLTDGMPNHMSVSYTHSLLLVN